MRETMDGTLGHFWTDPDDVYKLDKSIDGYVKLVDDTIFHVGTLRTQEFRSGSRNPNERLPRPEAVYGLTASTRAMFFDIAGVGQSNVMGQRASTQTVRTRGVVIDVPFAVLESTEFTKVELWISEVTQ